MKTYKNHIDIHEIRDRINEKCELSARNNVWLFTSSDIRDSMFNICNRLRGGIRRIEFEIYQ